jgi:outer membrane scaffolding protein for murein synthesis (MipA/OmpV family)
MSAKERGLQFDTRLAYPWRATDRLTVVHSVAVSAGNAKYMNTYFGVDSARSVQSGLPQYQAKAGVKEATVGTMASYRMTDRWAITGGVVAGQLLGDAAKSPIVRCKSNATGIVGASCAF